MPEIQLKVEQGELEGCVEVTEDGFKFNCYHHIPFAKPPLGDLRFRVQYTTKITVNAS